MNEPELRNGLGEQPEVVITEEQPKKVVQRFKYKELYEEAKALAYSRLVMLRAAGIIAALGWSAFIITILTK